MRWTSSSSEASPRFYTALRYPSLAEVDGLLVHVLDLEMIILSKEQANRDKDRATLPILRRTLRLRNESSGR